MEEVAAQRRPASLLSNKLKQEYLEISGFVRDSMSLAIVRPNTISLQVDRYKEVYIRHRPDILDGAVMALLAPWRG